MSGIGRQQPSGELICGRPRTLALTLAQLPPRSLLSWALSFRGGYKAPEAIGVVEKGRGLVSNTFIFYDPEHGSIGRNRKCLP